ncbi:MAG: antitoxin [Gammaproteobacteria bacterium]|nr:antitoxin [Gammaproteobacteria bacterium]
MMAIQLSPEEKELLDSYDNEEWESVMSVQELRKYQEAARNTFRKDKRVNIRMSGKDLELFQARALREGIPYQTLMASVLHKYVSGDLVDKTRNG